MGLIIRPLINAVPSKDMNVNGTAPPSPKIFKYDDNLIPAKVLKLNICMISESSNAANKFGQLAALTNGILIQTVKAGQTRTIATIKDNGDLATHFRRPYFGSTATGFLGSNNIFIGEMDFDLKPETVLGPNDLIKAVIQDNLTNIGFLRMSVELGIEN